VKRTLPVFLGLAIVMLAGHAGAQSAADVSGTWVGTAVKGTSTMTMVLTQSGNAVSGTITGVGTGNGPITGTIDGNTIRLVFDQGYEETPLLSVNGNEITGLLGGTTINLHRVKLYPASAARCRAIGAGSASSSSSR